jgi:tetratricopeptide (TPR) repeat protein
MPKLGRAILQLIVLTSIAAAPVSAAPNVLIPADLDSDCSKKRLERNSVGDFDADSDARGKPKFISSSEETPRDPTLIPVKAAVEAKLAASLPPLPDQIDLPVKLDELQPEHLGANNALVDSVVYTYYELSRLVGDESTKRPAAETGRLHKKLGDILLEYAYSAKDRGRGTLGMKRLLNAWIEYRRALALEKSDSEVPGKLLTIAEAAVKIRPSACNYLALGSANYLNGNLEQANECLQFAEMLNPKYPGISEAHEMFRNKAGARD